MERTGKEEGKVSDEQTIEKGEKRVTWEDTHTRVVPHHDHPGKGEQRHEDDRKGDKDERKEGDNRTCLAAPVVHASVGVLTRMSLKSASVGVLTRMSLKSPMTPILGS